jgi:hypothetical protein
MIMPATWRFKTASSDCCSCDGSQPTAVTITATPLRLASRSTAPMMLAKNGSATPGTATPIAASRPLRKVTASMLGTYWSSSIARSTRSRTSAET